MGHATLLSQAFSQLKSAREMKKEQIEDFLGEKQVNMRTLLEVVATFRQSGLEKMETDRDDKKRQLKKYFEEISRDTELLSTNDSISLALMRFTKAFVSEGDKTGGADWRSVQQEVGNELKQYRPLDRYQDLLLITASGDIVYTAEQGAELGQNLLTGSLKDSVLAKAFQKGLKAVALQDFEAYAPIDNRYAAFIAAPVYRSLENASFLDGKTDESDKLIGVIVLRLHPGPINAIVQKRNGQGMTGETYLAGKLNGHTAYRSDRRIKGQGRNVIGHKKSGPDINKALAGNSGTLYKTGSTGNPEVSAYAPLNVPGLNWCIINSMVIKELLVRKRADEDFFSTYIELYGYFDLFLIHPQGDIFYTVRREADYGTNILDGEYANSELGKLIKRVLGSGEFGISDYKPYAPSNNVPGAFIAQPLFYEGKIELAVALQLPDGVINTIMTQWTGMGETGETYLAGEDKLMRSDSRLAPHTHSIRASFNNPDTGAVDTESSRAALAGGTGEIITENYRNDAVLSAYAPLKIGDTTWALIAEMNKAEAFAVVTNLQWVLSAIAFLIACLVFFASRRFARGLTTPLLQINERLKTLASGDLAEEEISYGGKDEINEIIISTEQLQKGLKNTINQAKAVAAGDYNKEVKLRSQRDLLGQALSDMIHSLRQAKADNAAQAWLKNGQMQLNDKMSGERDIGRLAKKVIHFLAAYAGARIGAFYVAEETKQQESRLKLLATYAHHRRKNLNNEFKFGEGLAGQAALEKQSILITHAPDDYIRIRSGMGEAAPRNILVLPFLYEDLVKGVIEVGSFAPFTEIQLEFLNQAGASIAIGVHSLQSRTQ